MQRDSDLRGLAARESAGPLADAPGIDRAVCERCGELRGPAGCAACELAAAVQAEREACLAACLRMVSVCLDADDRQEADGARMCVAAIRARGARGAVYTATDNTRPERR